MKICGVNPPVITIFDENGRVDYPAMYAHADYLIAHGVHGLVYLGTSGEFAVMSQEEKLDLISRMVPYVKGRVQVLVGIGDTCLENTLELARCAKDAGADGLLSLVPYFSVYGEKNVEAYYHMVAQSVSLPLILYNFPALTGFDLNDDLVERLALSEPNIVGIKDTVPETEHLLQMLKIKEKKSDFSVFCAYETQAMQMAGAGIDGYINATGNFAPEFTRELWEASKEQNRERMRRASQSMEESAEVYAYAEPLLLAVKEAVYQLLDLRGYERLPGLPLGEEEKKGIQNILKKVEDRRKKLWESWEEKSQQ